MSWHILKVDATIPDETRSIRAFAWILVLAVALWIIVPIIVIALVVTR